MILIRHGQSEFNVVYSATRRDPGIRDPRLTEEGRRQAAAAAELLAGHGLARIVASPYTRALETAAIVAKHLSLPVTVDPRIGERVAFACDIGTPGPELRRCWPDLALHHVGECWWPEPEESEAALLERCAAFRSRMAALLDWQRVAVVSHWGFIRALTGLTVPNGAVLRLDPTRPEAVAEPLLSPPRPTPPDLAPA